MKTLFAVLPLCVALLAGSAAAQDVVLFKAKVLTQAFLHGYDVPQEPDKIIIIEGGAYRLRLDVQRVLIGDLAEQTVDIETGVPGQFNDDPPTVLYVLARKSPRGGLIVLEWGFAERGLCMDQDWKALGIEAEWRAQAKLHPCAPNRPPRS